MKTIKASQSKKIVCVVLATIISGALIATPREAQALNLNICEKLLEDLFIPPVMKQVLECNTPKNALKKVAYCATLPHCCLPGVCLTDPVCYTAKMVEEVAGYWKYKGEIYCSLREISAKDLLIKLAQDQIENAADILSAGVYPELLNTVNAEVDALALVSKRLPDNWRLALKNFIAPVYDHGHTGYAYGDVDNVLVIAKSNPLASPYLRADYDGITMGPVVILKDEHIQNIFNQPKVDLSQIFKSSYLSTSLGIISHELVHFKQYREMGRNNFITQYFFQLLSHKGVYCQDQFEQEAYRFDALMAATQGGAFCQNQIASVNYHVRTCNLGIPTVVCRERWSKVPSGTYFSDLQPNPSRLVLAYESGDCQQGDVEVIYKYTADYSSGSKSHGQLRVTCTASADGSWSTQAVSDITGKVYVGKIIKDPVNGGPAHYLMHWETSTGVNWLL